MTPTSVSSTKKARISIELTFNRLTSFCVDAAQNSFHTPSARSGRDGLPGPLQRLVRRHFDAQR
jgi:hypothetical protein